MYLPSPLSDRFFIMKDWRVLMKSSSWGSLAILSRSMKSNMTLGTLRIFRLPSYVLMMLYVRWLVRTPLTTLETLSTLASSVRMIQCCVAPEDSSNNPPNSLMMSALNPDSKSSAFSLLLFLLIILRLTPMWITLSLLDLKSLGSLKEELQSAGG